MQKFFSQAAAYLANNRRRRIWTKVVGGLACVVVFCTTYALILPAVTLESNAVYCGLEEHVHSQDCYETVLICGLEESEGHIHVEECYDADGNLICGVEESEGHVHTEDCYETVLICELEEHTHTDECYIDPNAGAEDAEIEDDGEINDGVDPLTNIPKRIVNFFASVMSTNEAAVVDDYSKSSDDAGVVREDGSDPYRVADSATLSGYENVLGTEEDGTRYAGRIWTDKSVTTGTFAGEGGNSYSLNEDEDFLTIFSALGSSRAIHDTQTTPVDLVLVLDVSTSMANTQNSTDSRIYHSVQAVNNLITHIMKLNTQSRVAVVTFANDTSTILPLNSYQVKANSDYLTLSNYNNDTPTFSVTVGATSTNGQAVTGSVSASAATYTQAGLYVGMELLADKTDVTATLSDGTVVDRTPVVILVSDGNPTRYSAGDYTTGTNGSWGSGTNNAKNANWWNFNSEYPTRTAASGGAARLLTTLLTAAYEKNKIDAAYNVDAMVFTIGLDLNEDADSYAYSQAALDPANWFTSVLTANVNVNEIEKENPNIAYDDWLALAYDAWTTYQNGGIPQLVGTHTASTNSSSYYYYNFNHPASDDVTSVNYVDEYFGVNNNINDLYAAFEDILSRVENAAFTPTQDAVGGFEEDTEFEFEGNVGLIYTDPLGEYMEFGELKGILIDGKALTFETMGEPETPGARDYGYVATISEGEKHPVYGTDIGGEKIYVFVRTETDENTGKEIQKVYVLVPSVILPAKAETITIGQDGTATMSTAESLPLRVIYSVKAQDAIRTPNGGIDLSKVSTDYIAANTDGTGHVYFYSNYYDSDTNSGYGNATVEFSPSLENRFYYFQNRRVIYSTGSEGIYKINTDVYTGTGSGYVNPKSSLTAIDQLVDTQDYYLVIDYYVATDKTDGDGNTIADHVFYVVERTGAELISSVAMVDASSTTAVIAAGVGENELTTVNGQVLATSIGGTRLGRLNSFAAKKSNNITVTSSDYYVPTYTGVGDGDVDGGMAASKGTLTVYLGNNGRLAVPSSNLEISKTVVNAPEIDENDEEPSYTFTVTLTQSVMQDNGKEADIALTGEYTYTVYNVNEKGRTPAETTTDDEGEEIITTHTLTSGGTITLKADQVAVFENLPVGTDYTVTETASSNYTTSFQVDAGSLVDNNVAIGTLTAGTTSTVAFTNTYLPDLTILKVDGTDNTTPLSGAEFTLTKTEGEVTYYYTTAGVWQEDKAVLTTGSDGMISLSMFEDGSYTLTETKAPDGYNLLNHSIALTVSGGKITGAYASGDITTSYEISDDGLTVTVPNSTGVTLPHTGGMGTAPFVIIGLVLLCGSGCLLYIDQRRRREGNV